MEPDAPEDFDINVRCYTCEGRRGRRGAWLLQATVRPDGRVTLRRPPRRRARKPLTAVEGSQQRARAPRTLPMAGDTLTDDVIRLECSVCRSRDGRPIRYQVRRGRLEDAARQAQANGRRLVLLDLSGRVLVADMADHLRRV